MAENLYQLILASQSPRRKELLSHLGVNFQVEPADINEDIDFNNPKELVEELSKQKAQKVFQGKSENTIVLGSDTTVALDNKIYNKPANLEEAHLFLEELSAKTHLVLSGVAIIGKEIEEVFSVITRVRFKQLSQQDIATYLRFNEYADKAGAYGIQGAAGAFVESLDGSYSGVVGLPQSHIQNIFTNLFGEEWREKFV